MTESHTAFVGSIPENYDRYLGPLIFEVYAEDLAKRLSVPSGGVVLETAAGTGIATRHLRNRLPSDVHMVVTDLNEAMLKIAQTKFAENERIAFQPANAMHLPFDAESFDAVVCQFSLMFFPDKLAAMREVVRVLKPGGTFLFNVWDSYTYNDFIRTVNETIAACLPDDPPTFFDVPYGYYHLDDIKTCLGEADFGEIEMTVLPRASRCEEARQVALAYVLGTPVRGQIEARRPESLPAIVDAVEHAIGKAYGYASISAKMQAMVFKAYHAA